MVDLEKLTLHRNEIARLAERYHVRNVRIFGSVARREATADSDVDFLVSPEVNCSLFDLGGLLEDLREMLGCEVDVVPENSLKPSLRNRVLNEAIPL